MPAIAKPEFVIGLDLGQSNDPTALAVLEYVGPPPQTHPQKLRRHYGAGR